MPSSTRVSVWSSLRASIVPATRCGVDINVGDPVTPAPIEVDYPALLDEPFVLLGYPLATVLAEKIVTMVDRGDTTTRDRDFADQILAGESVVGSWDPGTRRWIRP